jgi:hypothetical protein
MRHIVHMHSQGSQEPSQIKAGHLPKPDEIHFRVNASRIWIALPKMIADFL